MSLLSIIMRTMNASKFVLKNLPGSRKILAPFFSKSCKTMELLRIQLCPEQSTRASLSTRLTLGTHIASELCVSLAAQPDSFLRAVVSQHSAEGASHQHQVLQGSATATLSTALSAPSPSSSYPSQQLLWGKIISWQAFCQKHVGFARSQIHLLVWPWGCSPRVIKAPCKWNEAFSVIPAPHRQREIWKGSDNFCELLCSWNTFWAVPGRVMCWGATGQHKNLSEHNVQIQLSPLQAKTCLSFVLTPPEAPQCLHPLFSTFSSLLQLGAESLNFCTLSLMKCCSSHSS